MCTICLITGTNILLMMLWGEKSGPYMQSLHAAFALGAFLAPLIAKPFITDIPDTLVEDLNTSLVFNVSCNPGSIWASNCEDMSTVKCVCTEVCNGTSSAVITVYYDVYSNQSDCTIVEEQNDDFALRYSWAYWISAMFFVVPFLVFVYYSIRYDMMQCFNARKKVSPQGSQVEGSQDGSEAEDSLKGSQGEPNEEVDNKKKLLKDGSKSVVVEDSASSNESAHLKTYKYPASFLLFWFLLFYVGSENAYGSLLFTFSVKSEVQFDKQMAATVTAVFWGFFTFMRVFSIILAVLKVRASVMMTLNVSGSATAIFILAIFPHNPIAVWITSALLGASFASIFPTTMTWMSEHLPVSGKITAAVVAGGNLGDILVPAAMTALIGSVSPDSFVYGMVTLIALSIVTMVLLFTITAVYQMKSKPKLEQYQELR